MLDLLILNKKIKKLKNKIFLLKKNTNFVHNSKKIQSIDIKIKTLTSHNNSKLISRLYKQKNFLSQEKNTIKILINRLYDIEYWIKLFNKEQDLEILKEINTQYQKLTKKLHKLEIYTMFNNKHDKNNCYIDIQSGSGGIESQDWTKMLLKMYLKYSLNKKFKTNIITKSTGEIGGIKSITLKIKGNFAFGWFRTETGIHRLVRKSPFNASNRRHTSFSSVFVYPELNNDININIESKNLRIDVYRASGAGGQHVNRTESAVRITHIPSGIVTQCQNNRSQHKNKSTAIKQLKAKLYKLEINKKKIEKKIINQNKLDIGWGNQIRSYILDDSRIKDIRTKIERNDIHNVLNGDLNQFIETSLKMGL
ncbi:Peptide chain release factor RF2 [Buchnera aphidicola (Cinara kochiana kochiana)]|uniref:Peptide chain release factor 2 n=1 Tax=Buchnera aphidicola (Cinara kochiana kochiana) TaxID=2518976 RepID=A0A451D5X4_9GAMM|nr:peptide chain release factor 2 [Buchnera aphidicola]VFP81183.1 Peptide chain release factor RF2 [Buchnera aphidicola (Cinara kochiana kochiana)]